MPDAPHQAPKEFRTERDSMGEMKVPADAYYGARRPGRWRISRSPTCASRRRFIAAMGLIKWAAAEVNHELGLLDERARAACIQQAAQEVIDGKLDDAVRRRHLPDRLAAPRPT